jgi:hypothetical protein
MLDKNKIIPKKFDPPIVRLPIVPPVIFDDIRNKENMNIAINALDTTLLSRESSFLFAYFLKPSMSFF